MDLEEEQEPPPVIRDTAPVSKLFIVPLVLQYHNSTEFWHKICCNWLPHNALLVAYYLPHFRFVSHGHQSMSISGRESLYNRETSVSNRKRERLGSVQRVIMAIVSSANKMARQETVAVEDLKH